MKISEQPFHLCKIFVDETAVPYENEECFVYGALMMPIDCDLPIRLGQARKNHKYVNAIHSNAYTRHHKYTDRTIRAFLDAFIESGAVFRSILVKPSTWGKTSDHKQRARLIGLLLSYPWVLGEGSIFNTLSRPRIIFDRQSMNPGQIQAFESDINLMLSKKNLINGSATHQIADAAIVFADTRAFDELQLTDIILGIIRSSYLISASVKLKDFRKDNHDYFLDKFPKINSFVSVNRKDTDQKLDVWNFIPKNRT